MQAEVIQGRHWDLNETIRETKDEQLLLNLVRLRYDEIPYFLQVTSISTQFSAGGTVGGSATLPEAAASTFGLSGSLSYSESPVVTWSIPDSKAIYGRLNASMGADQILVLTQSGWDPRKVFRIGVRKLNRLQGLSYSIEDGIETPSSYGEFIEALGLIVALEKEDLVDFAQGVKSSSGAAKIPLSQLDSRAIPPGLAYGLQFMTREGAPDVVEPLKLFKPLFLRFSKRSDGDSRSQRLRELLSLDSESYSFGIVDTVASGKEQLLAESSKLSQIYDPDAKLSEIVLNNRSMIEVLRIASTSVQVPEDHIARGYARPRSAVADDWLTILSSPSEPMNTWLKVEYRGSWFYIPADETTTRSHFTLIHTLFASVVGEVPGAQPLLTLPVN